MEDLSLAEENYLKNIFHLSEDGAQTVTTNQLSEVMQTKPASVSDMIKRLAVKELLDHVPYRGVQITASGRKAALKIIRKHRLWEVFLVQKLKFHWDEVHDIAEQLEHVQSPALVERLDEFLGHPKYDPHGDPIPDVEGNFPSAPQFALAEIAKGQKVELTALRDSGPLFLQYLDHLGLKLGSVLTVLDHMPFDGSYQVSLADGRSLMISREAAVNLMVSPLEA